MIVLPDCDGVFNNTIVHPNDILTPEIKTNLGTIYQNLHPLKWCHPNHEIFKARVFILHTGREVKYNIITRQWFKVHFGLEHFRIVNVPFMSHDKYILNKVDAISKLIEEWSSIKEPNEIIKIIDDDQQVINKIFQEYHGERDLEIYTVLDEELVLMH